MDVKTGLFYVFSTILLFAAFRVITARNPVYARTVSGAGLLSGLRDMDAAEGGVSGHYPRAGVCRAVMVLFLFVVMMLDVNIDNVRPEFLEAFPTGGPRLGP